VATSGPGASDIKRLFARSGNRCAFPKCAAPLAFDKTLTGEVCHIKGARPGSARYDPQQTDVERHGYSNLILMCPTHHTVIDDDEEAYTVERLHKIKAEQEARAAPISEAEASLVAQTFVQSVSNVGQSGGLSAHTVNASNITIQNAPPADQLTHERQIQAIENLWKAIQNLRNKFNHIIFIDNIFTQKELDSYFQRREHANIGDCVREYADMNFALRKLASAGCNDAGQERPFVSHRVWSVFFVVQALYGRSALLITNSYRQRRLISWKEDSGCDQLLRAILPGQTVEWAKGLEIGGLHRAIEQLENQFLAEAGMNKSRL